MRAGRSTRGIVIAGIAAVAAGSLVSAQVGRGGSQWLTALGDAQRTSWLRTDDKISVQTLSNPGFELQWQSKLGNQPRGLHGLNQGVTAAGVTLFVPMSLVTGSSNTLYAIDNDLGYVVWERRFDAALPPVTAACPGGISAGATRIVRMDGTVTATPGFGGGRGAVGYRSLLGEPGQGAPVEGRGGAAAAGRGAGAPAGPAPAAGRGAGAPAAQAPGAGQRGAPPPDRIPGSPKPAEGQGGQFGFLFRPSGVGYAISSDGMLHVVGLASGKDIQKPAPFLPANAKWSSPVAIDTTLYAATSAGCGNAPHAVWAIDLDSDTKPVVSWKTNGGPVVGAVAFTSEGTLIAAIGSGQTTGDGKANAIVALDAKTLQVKDWFTQPSAEFATGPTILRHRDREVVVAATKDGRVLVLDAKSLGGADHGSPLYASKPWVESGGSVSADALAAWQQSSGGTTPTFLDLVAHHWPRRRRCVRDERRDLVRRRGGVEARRLRHSAVAGARMGVAQSRRTCDAPHGQRRRLRVGDWASVDGGRQGHARRAARLRRRDWQAIVHEQQGDDDLRVTGESLDRPRSDLRRRARRHSLRVWLQR